MDKVEKFIRDCTRNCSNVFINTQLGGTEENAPWLTPEQALKAVEIAREETIEKVKELLLSEVLPCFMHGGEADEVVAMLDDKIMKMSKVEELAEKAYPIGDTKLRDAAPSIGRKAFIDGYHQAEKDNELTWEDMRLIDRIASKLLLLRQEDDKDFYQEVLKRYKELKK